MYDELIKRIHRQAVYLPEKFNKNAELFDVLMKSADAIEELRKMYLDSEVDNINLTGWLAEEHAKHLWIPCSERLPEDKERVLIFYWLSTKPKTPWYKVATFSKKLSDVDEYDLYGKDHPGFYGSDSEYGYYEHTDVEYWMPLPEPPDHIRETKKMVEKLDDEQYRVEQKELWDAIKKRSKSTGINIHDLFELPKEET